MKKQKVKIIKAAVTVICGIFLFVCVNTAKAEPNLASMPVSGQEQPSWSWWDDFKYMIGIRGPKIEPLVSVPGSDSNDLPNIDFGPEITSQRTDSYRADGTITYLSFSDGTTAKQWNLTREDGSKYSLYLGSNGFTNQINTLPNGDIVRNTWYTNGETLEEQTINNIDNKGTTYTSTFSSDGTSLEEWETPGPNGTKEIVYRTDGKDVTSGWTMPDGTFISDDKYKNSNSNMNESGQSGNTVENINEPAETDKGDGNEIQPGKIDEWQWTDESGETGNTQVTTFDDGSKRIIDTYSDGTVKGRIERQNEDGSKDVMYLPTYNEKEEEPSAMGGKYNEDSGNPDVGISSESYEQRGLENEFASNADETKNINDTAIDDIWGTSKVAYQIPDRSTEKEESNSVTEQFNDWLLGQSESAPGEIINNPEPGNPDAEPTPEQNQALDNNSEEYDAWGSSDNWFGDQEDQFFGSNEQESNSATENPDISTDPSSPLVDTSDADPDPTGTSGVQGDNSAWDSLSNWLSGQSGSASGETINNPEPGNPDAEPTQEQTTALENSENNSAWDSFKDWMSDQYDNYFGGEDDANNMPQYEPPQDYDYNTPQYNPDGGSGYDYQNIDSQFPEPSFDPGQYFQEESNQNNTPSYIDSGGGYDDSGGGY